MESSLLPFLDYPEATAPVVTPKTFDRFLESFYMFFLQLLYERLPNKIEHDYLETVSSRVCYVPIGYSIN